MAWCIWPKRQLWIVPFTSCIWYCSHRVNGTIHTVWTVPFTRCEWYHSHCVVWHHKVRCYWLVRECLGRHLKKSCSSWVIALSTCLQTSMQPDGWEGQIWRWKPSIDAQTYAFIFSIDGFIESRCVSGPRSMTGFTGATLFIDKFSGEICNVLLCNQLGHDQVRSMVRSGQPMLGCGQKFCGNWQ